MLLIGGVLLIGGMLLIGGVLLVEQGFGGACTSTMWCACVVVVVFSSTSSSCSDTPSILPQHTHIQHTYTHISPFFLASTHLQLYIRPPHPQLTIAGRDTFNIGIGTALPFNETALTLAPIPPWKYLGFDSDAQDRYEAYLEQLGRVCMGGWVGVCMGGWGYAWVGGSIVCAWVALGGRGKLVGIIVMVCVCVYIGVLCG